MSVKLNLSKAQLSKLRNGHAVQLKIHQIGQGNTTVSLHPANINKLSKAIRQGKGVRVQLNEDEIMGSGLMSQAKSLGKAALKNKQLRKLANQGLDKGMNYASDYAVSQGADENMVNFVKKQARRQVDRELDNFVEGSGFMSQAKSMGKAALKNKQLRKLANQGLDKGMNYASDYAVSQGADENMVNFVKKQARRGIDNELDNFVEGGDLMAEYNAYKQGGNMFSKKNLNKGLKVGLKGLKQANKVGKLMGYDSMQDMAIEGIVGNTLGRIDPTGGIVTNIVENELKKQADKQIEKHGGRYGKGYVKLGSGYVKIGSGNSAPVVRNSVNGRFIKTYNPIA